MGRRKIGMELISNKRARNLTFQKRKKGLEKKADELSILCQVKLCMIIYGPKDGDKQEEATIWPDEDTARSLIDLYSARSDDDKRSRTHDLTFFFNDLTRKVQIESAKLRKKNQEAKYPTWDKRYDHFSSGRLKLLAALLGAKVEAIKQRLEYLKATQTMSLQNMSGLSFLGTKVTQQAHCLMQNTLVSKSSLPVLEIIQQHQHQPLVGPHYQMNFPGETHGVGPVTEFRSGHQMMMLNNGAIAGNSNNNVLINQQHPMSLGVGIRESNMLVSNNNFIDPQPMCYFLPMFTPTNYFEYPTLLPSAAAAASYQMHPSQRQKYYGTGHDFQLGNVKYEEE